MTIQDQMKQAVDTFVASVTDIAFNMVREAIANAFSAPAKKPITVRQLARQAHEAGASVSIKMVPKKSTKKKVAKTHVVAPKKNAKKAPTYKKTKAKVVRVKGLGVAVTTENT